MSCLICFTMKYNFLGVKIFSSFFPDTSEAIIPQHRYRGMLGQVALVVKWIERPLQMLYGTVGRVFFPQNFCGHFYYFLAEMGRIPCYGRPESSSSNI